MTPLLAVRDLSVSFGRRHVLHEVSFELSAGQRLGLIGESGSGKSLTALAVLGLLPDAARASGSVQFEGRELLGLPDRDLAPIRGRRVAMVFQEPMTALDPTMKVGRQVAEVIRLHQHGPERRRHSSGRGGAESGSGHAEPTGTVPTRIGPARSTRDLVLQMLRSVELTDAEEVANRYPHQLSGGQRQRVVLAMALVNQPDLLICDEPTTALDVTVQARVLALLDTSLREREAACLFISHDLAVVSQVCTDVLVMLDGRIVDSGPVAQVLGTPRHPYTAGLIATARLDLVEPGQRLPILSDFYRPGQSETGHTSPEP